MTLQRSRRKVGVLKFDEMMQNVLSVQNSSSLVVDIFVDLQNGRLNGVFEIIEGLPPPCRV